MRHLVGEIHYQIVKSEGGKSVYPQTKAMAEAGIPICARFGLTLQHINVFGGFKIQRRTEAAARRLIEDAKAVQKAGVLAVTLEAIPVELAQLITKQLDIPAIRIGTDNQADEQVLIYADLPGLFSDFTSKFVERYANIGELVSGAVRSYIDDAAAQEFPTPENEHYIDDTIIEKLH